MSGCTSNGACDDGSVCELEWWGECRCAAKCRTDSDCGGGLVCVPTILSDAKGFGAMAGDNECRPSLCLSDADCASGFCVLWEAPCGTVGGTRCFEEEDACRTTADCADPEAVCRPLDGPFGCDDAGETCD